MLTFKNGLKDGIPIGLAYFAVSIAFGVTAVDLGVSIFNSIFISMTNLTSAGQLAGVVVVAVLGSVVEIIITQLVINSRYFLMSLSLSQKLGKDFKFYERFICAFGITDEIFAVAISKKQLISSKYMYGLILIPYFSWALGTAFGAIVGSFLPEIIVSAMGIALFAMFISIISSAALENYKVIFVISISAILSCLFYFLPQLKFISQGFVYIICALVSAILAAIFFPIKEDIKDD